MVVETCLSGCVLTSDYSRWIPIALIATLTVVLILAALFMLSRLLNKREWEALAKTELWSTANALIWVVIIASVATLLCSLSCQINGDESPFTTAISYVADVQGALEKSSDNLINGAKDIRINKAYAYSLFDAMVSPEEGCGYIANSLEQIAFMLAPFIGSLIIQKFALTIIAGTAFTLLLPVGIILRLIPFAREAGAFLIAIAVALYIVLPLTYVFAERATANIPLESASINSCDDIAAVKSMLSAIGNALPQAVFFPALSMIITIAAARVLSKVFTYDFLEMA